MACFERNRAKCTPKVTPLIHVAYPNENKSHIVPEPLKGTPGVDPCCKLDSPCSGENPEQHAFCYAHKLRPEDKGACYDHQTKHQRQCECSKCLEELETAQKNTPCWQHVEGNEWQDLRRKSKDPVVQEIRDRLKSSQLVHESMKWCPTDESLTNVVRRFRQHPLGILGQATVHYGAAQDCDYPKAVTHGVQSDENTPATKVVNPPMLRWFDQLERDINESIYNSNKTMPVGRLPDAKDNLPEGFNPYSYTCGKPSDKSINAGLLINPPKTRDVVAAESDCCAPLYRKSHEVFKAGEQICRNYGGNFKVGNRFGKKTPHDVAGRWAATLTGSWKTCDPDPMFVHKVYADHIDFRRAKLGQPQERNCIGKNFGPGYTFGVRKQTEIDPPIKQIIQKHYECTTPGKCECPFRCAGT